MNYVMIAYRASLLLNTHVINFRTQSESIQPIHIDTYVYAATLKLELQLKRLSWGFLFYSHCFI